MARTAPIPTIGRWAYPHEENLSIKPTARRDGNTVVVEFPKWTPDYHAHKNRLSWQRHTMRRDEANDFAGDVLDIVQAIWDDVPTPKPMVVDVQDWKDGKVKTPDDRPMIVVDGEGNTVAELSRQLKPIIR